MAKATRASTKRVTRNSIRIPQPRDIEVVEIEPADAPTQRLPNPTRRSQQPKVLSGAAKKRGTRHVPPAPEPEEEDVAAEEYGGEEYNIQKV